MCKSNTQTLDNFVHAFHCCHTASYPWWIYRETFQDSWCGDAHHSGQQAENQWQRPVCIAEYTSHHTVVIINVWCIVLHWQLAWLSRFCSKKCCQYSADDAFVLFSCQYTNNWEILTRLQSSWWRLGGASHGARFRDDSKFASQVGIMPHCALELLHTLPSF